MHYFGNNPKNRHVLRASILDPVYIQQLENVQDPSTWRFLGLLPK